MVGYLYVCPFNIFKALKLKLFLFQYIQSTEIEVISVSVISGPFSTSNI